MNDDARSFEHYEKPAHREPAAGPASKLPKPPRPGLTEYVPIRLSADTMAAVRERAHAEGVSVSSWIRRLIARELTGADPDDLAARVGALNAKVEEALRRVEAKLHEMEQPGVRT